jgi:environmental stress-induced protein Ves
MIITSSKFKQSSWSGGKTRELFIYPPESSYPARNFAIRISSASVDIEESNFTSLPNYKRALMLLQGQLEIKHQGHYSKILNPFECDYFDGAWNTSARGKVIDFNLMTSKTLKGELIYQVINKESKLKLEKKGNQQLVGIYLIQGKFHCLDEKERMSSGDLLVLIDKEDSSELQALEDSKIIYILVT